MKLARIGLGSATAFALMAMLGAGSASASGTTLCKSAADSPYCISADSYPANTTIKGSTSGFKIHMWIPGTEQERDFACSSSALTMENVVSSGEPESISLSAWSFSGCENITWEEECPAGSFTVENLPYQGSISHTTGSSGVVAFGKASPEAILHTQCSGMDCEYSLPSAELQGGNPANLVLSEQQLTKVGGFFCGLFNTVLKPTTYTVSAPEPVYVAQTVLEEGYVRLCKEVIAGKPCPDGSTYHPGTIIEVAAPKVEIKSGGTTYECGETTMQFQTAAFGANPLPLVSDTTTLPYTCAFVGECMTETSPGSNGQISRIGTGESSVQLRARWTFSCGPVAQCTLGLNSTAGWLKYQNGSLTELTYNEMEMERLSPSCPRAPRLTAHFHVVSPLPLFPS